jgi:hypothetical protein
MPRHFQFHPDKVAYYEKAGWEAYYERQWLRAFGLLVRLNREEFGMPWPTAILAAVDVVRASRAFAPLDNDIPTSQAQLAQFYAKAGRSVQLGADAPTLAALEMEYWVVHRRLAIARQQNPQDEDLTPMVDALTGLHAALFSSTAEAMRPSAEWRAQAAAAVDRITGRRSTDVAADWRAVECCLQQAYRAVQAAVG